MGRFCLLVYLGRCRGSLWEPCVAVAGPSLSAQLALHRVVNPVVMGVLFFIVITPVSLLMRLTGKRPLALEFEPEASSYWMTRGIGLQPGPMTKQY